MGFKSVLLLLILMDVCFGNQITQISPANYLVTEKPDFLTIRLNFQDEVSVEERDDIKIILTPKSDSSPCSNITIENKETATQANMKSINFIKESTDINCFCIYKIIYVNGSNSEETNFEIYIYRYELKLKNPKDRYFLVDEDSNKIAIAKYIFENEQSPDAINTINCVDASNSDNINDNLNFKINSTGLFVAMPYSHKPVDYNCKIFPRYSTTSIEVAQSFKLCFHEFLLETEAIYVEKEAKDTDILNNNNITFKIRFKEEFNHSNLVIQDYLDKDVNYRLKSCDRDKLCEFDISTGDLNQPGKYSLFYKIMQERKLFYVLYEKVRFEKCYYKSENKLLTLLFSWTPEMDYTHSVYLNSTTPHSIHSYENEKTTALIIIRNYTLTASEINIGLFSFMSSIVEFNFVEYNPINPDRLFFSVIDDISVNENMHTILFINNRSDQIFNMTFRENDTVGVLDEIIFVPIDDKLNKFVLSKTNGQCKSSGSNYYYCNMTDYINSVGVTTLIGTYKIKYSDLCNNEASISNVEIEIKQTYNLISFSPSWINQSQVNGTYITLLFDLEVENKIEVIEVLNYSSQEVILSYSKNDSNVHINKNNITFRLDDNLGYGIYNVNLVTDLNIEYYGISTFKISNEDITFNFKHHYFVLNSGGRNLLRINASVNSDDFGCKLYSSNRKEIHNTTVNCDKFEFEFNNTGQIYFSYFDKDNFLIPIVDNIIIVNIYTDIFSFISLQECYYLKFDLITDLNKYKDVELVIFLKDKNNETKILDNNNNIFTNNDMKLLIQNYNLYVSEAIFDDEVYLYKANSFELTDIEIPEYIMKPNLYVNFTEVSCDLSSNTFEMYKQVSSNIRKKLERCKYYKDAKTLNCEISGSFYTNTLFGSYYYKVNEKEIVSKDDNSIFTFASNRLNDSDFSLDIGKDILKYNITIQLKNSDFYFPLISNLMNYKLTGNEYEPINYIRDINLTIDDEKGRINFTIELKLTENYLIGNLTRRKKYELTEDESFYHNFNYMIDNKRFTITPTIFAYNQLEDEYEVSISYSDYNDMNLFIEKDNLTNCRELSYGLEKRCFLDIKKNGTDINFIVGRAQNFIISIGNDQNEVAENIRFIYYELSEDSKKCKSKTSTMKDIELEVYFPDETLANKVELSTKLTQTKNFRSNTHVTYSLNGEQEDILERSLELYINNDLFYHTFSLKDIGLDVLPLYNITLYSEKKIYLFPVENQRILAEIKTSEFISANMNDIEGFKIKKDSLSYTIVKERIDSTKLYISFNLTGAAEGSYTLYYIDRCGEDIKTDIEVIIRQFTIDRHYFVLNNNHNQNGQTLGLSLGHEIQLNVSIHRDNINLGNMNYDSTSRKYYYNLNSNSVGNYTFEVNFNGGTSVLNEIVYVRKELSDLLIIHNEPASCLYYHDPLKEISYSVSPSQNSVIKNINDFNSYWNANTSASTIFIPDISQNEKSFKLPIQYNIINNQSYFIFLTEKTDREQPIFVFSYKYTDISLNREYSKVLYTDTYFIEFEMSCPLKGNLTFLLENKEKERLNFLCDAAHSKFNSTRNIYICYLFITNDHSLNNLLKDEIRNGYYNLSYQSTQSKIIQENIYLSYEISKVTFSVSYEEPVRPGAILSVTLNTTQKPFYMPNIVAVRYFKGGNRDELFDASIVSGTLSLNSTYFLVSFKIDKHTKHTIYDVCRKECTFCYNSSCTQLFDKIVSIESIIPEVYFDFDRHYINLINFDNFLPDLNIKIRGDADEIDNLYFNHTIDGKNYTTGILNKHTKYDFSYRFRYIGKYTFLYKPYNYKDNLTIPNDMVFVTYYFTDLLVFHDESDGCLFFKTKGNKGILALLTIREDYTFINDVPISDFDLYVEELYEIRFPYEKNLGYQIVQEYENDFNYNDEKPKTIYIVEKNVNHRTYRYGKVENKTITSFEIDTSNNYSYFYKDNIVLKNMYCNLKNIYVQPLSNLNEPYRILSCDYDKENKRAFCNAKDYNFDSNNNDYFEFFIGYQDNKYISVYDIEDSVLIYNAIVDGNFIINYLYPNLTIYSVNFPMNHTFSLIIDDDNITKFDLVNENNVVIKFSRNLSELNYVKEITRISHDKDRPDTKKTKFLNATIHACEKYHIFYEGRCRSCYEISLFRYEMKDYIWFQNGACVINCTDGYLIYDSKNYYCDICNETTYSNGRLVCGCMEGTVKLEEDNICYLPESEQIQTAALIRPNIFCYRIDGTTHNYCHLNNTANCIIISQSGHDFPVCQCKNGYFGKYCENKDGEEVDFEEKYIDPILNGIIEDLIDENSTKTIAKIRGIIHYFELDLNYNYIKNISISKINLYIQASVNLIQNNIMRGSQSFQIYDIIELSVYFLYYNIYINTEAKAENFDYQGNLTYILNHAHYANFIVDRETSIFNINSDGLNLITFISYRRSTLDISFKRYIKNENERSEILGFLDLMDNIINNNELLVVTVFNKQLFRNTLRLTSEQNDGELDSDSGLIIKFSINNNNKTILSNLINFKVYIHSSNLRVNYNLANYYQQFNIGIYNVYDECFVEPCYYNRRLSYDLTQEYRKRYLFQKLLLNSENCKYNSFDIETNNIEFFCSKFDEVRTETENNEYFNYGYINFITKYHRIEDEKKAYKLLPIKCTKKIDDLKNNIALRAFLVVLVLELIYITFINVLSLGRLNNFSMKIGLDNDKIYEFPDLPRSVTEEKQKIDNSNDLDKYRHIDFWRCLWDNLKELHPIFSLTRVSLIQPLILNSFLVIFNLLGLFGFNALFYTEGLIEKRIYRPSRSNFDYPMKKEFHKIILSIICQAILCFLIKLIILVPHQLVDNFKKYVKEHKDGQNVNHIIVRADDFEKELWLRRIIGVVIMTIICAFFFYYSVVFCGIYINTQINWLYSCFWTLIWIYLIISPLCILVISLIEDKIHENKKNEENEGNEKKEKIEGNKKNEKNEGNKKIDVIYYVKRLFVF